MLVAIDGPAGAGKSTVARAVARALGFTYLDSGAMYRAAALAEDPARARVDLDQDGSVLLGGEDVTSRIRTPQVSARASEIAADPGVRANLVDQQRRIISTGDWVAEGRDIGTVVAPHAEVKVFLTAHPEERARRRAHETGQHLAVVTEELATRDRRDTTRAESPLTRADDAIELDTTGLSIDEVVEKIVGLVR
jgi:cytidylate kinase